MNHRHRFAQQQRPPVLADCTRNKSRNKIKQKKSIDSSSRNAALLDGSGRTTTNQTFFFSIYFKEKKMESKSCGVGGGESLSDTSLIHFFSPVVCVCVCVEGDGEVVLRLVSLPQNY